MKINKLTTISLLTSTLLFAASVKEINKEATSYLKANESAKAYQLLESEYKKGNFDNQTLFLLGTSAKQQNDVDNAIKYFEELLSRDKGAHRVRLDLATLYYKKQNLDKAKELLLIVKSSNPPKKVGDNIDGFLAAIEKGIPKNWSINASLGYLYDSNVNAGPNTDTVLMYNLPFTLSDDAQRNSDYAFLYGISLNHLKQFDDFSWQSSIGANITDYRKIHNLDSKSIYISTGPSLKKDNTTYSLPFILNTSIIGHKDRYYSISKGIAPQISYQLKPNISLGLTLGLQNKDYYQSSNKESNSVTFSPSSRYFLDQSSYVSLGAYLGKENSKTETNSNNSKGLNIGYYKAFSQNLNTYFSASINSTNYEGEEIAFNKSREDSARVLNGNISYFIDSIKSNLSLNLSYTKNISNIDMYDYDRKQIGLTLSKTF
jgi:outer membrane protein